MDWLRSRRADWRNLVSLTRSEQRLLGWSLIALPAVVLAHRLVGLSRTRGMLDKTLPRLERATGPGKSTLCRARSISRIVRIAGNRCLLRPTCLQHALFLRWILARHGIPAELRLGVRKLNGVFEAHAWLECFGHALNESSDVQARFSTFGRPEQVPDAGRT